MCESKQAHGKHSINFSCYYFFFIFIVSGLQIHHYNEESSQAFRGFL